MIAELEKELATRLLDVPVYFGNRNWAPYMTDAIEQMHADGHTNVLALVTSAYSSYSGCRQYREDFAKSLTALGLHGAMTITKSRAYFDHPGFLEPIVDGVDEAISSLEAEGHAREAIQILFTTHSIPHGMSELSGPQTKDADDPSSADPTGGWYVAQHQAACRWVLEQLAERGEVPPWKLCYQSRSGAPHIPWLEPDVNDVIEVLAGDGAPGGTPRTAVVVVPIGFITDHVEVIWDLDTEAKQTAAEAGLAFRRVATSGTDPRFIAALADMVEEHVVDGVEPKAVTSFGIVGDTCGHNCCQNSPRVAVAPEQSVDALAEIGAQLTAREEAARAAATEEASA